MKHFKFRILFFLILGTCVQLFSQNNSTVKRVQSIEPFLKAEDVHIQQNSGDDLWITTPVKVMRYNSVDVRDYNKFKGIPSEVGKEYISTYTDSENKIWLAGNNGLAVLDSKKDEFRFVSNTTGRIYILMEDSGKQLWMAAENGIFKLKVDSEKTDFGISRFLSENTMATTSAVHQGRIVFAGPNGILTIDRRSGKFNKIDTGYFQELLITSSVSFPEFLLFGTERKGFFKLEADFKKFQKVLTLPYQLASADVTHLEKFDDEVIVSTNGNGIFRIGSDLKLIGKIKDAPSKVFTASLNRNNLLWMVSNRGLFIKNYSRYAVNNIFDSHANSLITALETDSRGQLWMGTGDGLSIWNPQTDKWKHISNLNNQSGQHKPTEITALSADEEQMWVATADDGVYKMNINTLAKTQYSTGARNKIQVEVPKAIFIDSRNNTWIGGEMGYLTRVDKRNLIKTFPIKDVQAIAELGPKKIIVATKNRIYSLNPVTGRITDLESLNANKDLLYYAINDLKITNSGMGLIATKGAGLIIYDFVNDKFELINEEAGLPSNNLEGILIDETNAYWLATDKGLSVYDPDNGELKSYSVLNGLSTNELTTGFAILKNGDLVLGSARGINVFHPQTMLAQPEFRPRVDFNNIIIPGEKEDLKRNRGLRAGKKLQLDENTGFQIGLQGISHLDPESLLYSWKLEGVDQEWSKPTPMNTASFSNLPPGDYILKVKAKVANSVWSKPVEVPIEIVAAAGTFSTVYLFMGIGILATILIFAYVFTKRSREADKLAKQELSERLKEEFKAPVESAVKSLSKISAASEAGNPEDLQRYAARFDELFQQILNFNYQESVYEISKISMKTHLPQIIKEIKPVYSLKNIEMIINDQWGEGEFYYNMEMLDKIFFSLISGSAGYSFREGKIIMNLIRTNVGDLKLQITDNGRGIPLSDVKLLEKNKQSDTKPRFRDKGGLKYILKAKDLIQKAGGSFSYETEKNEGSTFTAVLKNRQQEYRKVPERAAAIFKAEKSTVKKTSKKPGVVAGLNEGKILIIENETETREQLFNSLSKYCQVYQAGTAEEGIEKASMIFPDIIITAAVLPDMNAFQLSKMLKANAGLNHIDIFLLAEEATILADEQLKSISEVIRKPLEMDAIIALTSEKFKKIMEVRRTYISSYKEDAKVQFKSKNDEEFIARIQEMVIENIRNENFQVHDLSAAIGISSNALFMKLKSLVNLTPQELVDLTRVNYALSNMGEDNSNILEVTYKAGFENPKQFYSSFKKFYGYDFSNSVEEFK
ncbi:triple tyrosine motif-containing protein [Christiangramia aquimixticola]|uniref:hybrid sensor histidine kinase/response regulator transcription factor n=1 Tax=Christiangramia aquimixticola TaxID=1697558 RepID=UPI003AA9C02F